MAILNFDIPFSMVNLLDYYSDSGLINISNFITDSVRNHIEYIQPNYSSSIDEVNSSNMFPVVIETTDDFASMIGFSSYRLNTTPDKIVNEAIQHSFPLLIEQEEAIKDSRLVDIEGDIKWTTIKWL